MLRAFNNWFNTKHQVGEFDGVKFASASDTEGFASLMSNALERIKTADALRYSRVLRNVEWIIDVAHPNGANHGLYVWKLRRFQFDFDFEGDDESLDNLTSYVALCLVHESTFGVLCSRGALSNKSEALCVLAASEGLEPQEGAYHVEKDPSKNWLSSHQLVSVQQVAC